MEPSARLIIRIGAQPEQTHIIDREITIFGREAINDVVVNDVEVSRRHARLVVEGNKFLIEDLGSTNGTFVNEKRVTSPTQVFHGDLIEMGKGAEITFQHDNPGEQPTQPVEMISPGVIPRPDGSSYPPIERREQLGSNPDYVPPPPTYDPPPRSRPQPPPVETMTPEIEEAYAELAGAAEDYYRPPADDPIIVGANDGESSGCRRYVMACGCLVLLSIVLGLVGLFVLDRFYSDLLYCGPLEGLWDTILTPLLNTVGKEFTCS